MKNKKDIIKLAVDELLDNKENWIKVKRYDPDFTNLIGGDAWSYEYDKLSKHHEKETEFLLAVIEELKTRVINLQLKYNSACDELTELNEIT